ncbi:MAG TPA: PspC domain-containing protein [Acidimicrobiales bacterium]|nr:PspC domain-containing protein [Acidimicrobiales bacterium]
MKIKTDQPNAGGGLLRRSVNGRVLGGVAAGFAKHFGFDVTYVRLALVVLSFIGGAGIPFYLAAWLLVPEEGSNIAIVDAMLARTGGQPS